METTIFTIPLRRTQGDIYIGVVGPVRTGKSTFIKRFMDMLVLPNIDSGYRKERATMNCRSTFGDGRISSPSLSRAGC